ncbi:MAG TPA: DUF348 domain-containing protein [Firmicutes bacterium]|nr:DUF348 domain-containing protein [Bacillota bacterium]
MLGSKKLLRFALLAIIGCVLALAVDLIADRMPITQLAASNIGQLTPSQTLNRLMFAKRVTVMVDGKERSVWTSARTVGDAVSFAGVRLGPLDRIEPDPSSQLMDDMQVKVVRVTHELVQEEEVVPYRTVRVASRSLNRGETREIQPGINGKVINTYQVIKENGQVQERTLVDSVTVVEKQDRMIEEGTIATISRGGQVLRYSKVITVEATAYTADVDPVTGKPDDAWGGMTASGKMAVPGVTIAADLKVLPMYTRVYVEGMDSVGKKYSGIYQVMDTGSAIKGNKIDIFMETFQEMKKFGRRKMKVYVLE